MTESKTSLPISNKRLMQFHVLSYFIIIIAYFGSGYVHVPYTYALFLLAVPVGTFIMICKRTDWSEF